MVKMVLCALCVIPICGCAWMVNWMAAEPPPPMLHSLPEVQVIRVVARSMAPSHMLSPGDVDDGLARFMNVRSNGPHVITEADPGRADAVLAVSILQEQMAQSDRKPDMMQCKFRIQFSAALTRSDRQQIWSRSVQWASYEMDFVGTRPPGFALDCAQANLQEQVVRAIGEKLVDQLARSK